MLFRLIYQSKIIKQLWNIETLIFFVDNLSHLYVKRKKITILYDANEKKNTTETAKTCTRKIQYSFTVMILDSKEYQITNYI